VANAQGLNISSEPGIIHVDVRKIFDNARKALPPTAQLDGIGTDPDIINGIVQRVSQFLESEILGTAAHESQHEIDFHSAWQQGKPFTSIQEAPAEQYEKQIKQRYFPNIK
jgi:hypothetical protein